MQRPYPQGVMAFFIAEQQLEQVVFAANFQNAGGTCES
jgi:hypothetical protein